MCAHPPQDWFAMYREDTVAHVRDQFRMYHILNPFQTVLGETGTDRAGAIVDYVAEVYHGPGPQTGPCLRPPAYFPNHNEFRRWLRTAAYRESLRLVFNNEHCERLLPGLTPRQVRVLRWRYFDQLTAAQMAPVARPQTNDGHKYDAAAAEAESRGAYQAFCALIRGSAAPPPANAALARTSAVEFPRYPV